MTKNIDIGEDTKLELSILAAKHGCNLKAFIEAQLNAMAETGKSFTEIQSELIGARNSLKCQISDTFTLLPTKQQPTNDLHHK